MLPSLNVKIERKKGKGGSLFQKLIALFCGLCLLIPFGYRLYSYGVFKYQSVAVEGVVTKSLRGRDIGGRAFVEYKDLDGNVHEFASKYKIHWLYAPKIGERISVLYLAHDPDTVIVDSWFHYLVLPLFLIAVGLSLIRVAVKRERLH